VAALAAAADTLADRGQLSDDPDDGIGAFPATPVMRWFTDRSEKVFHQSTVLRTPAGLSRERMQEVLQRVLDHHDALRMRVASGAALIAPTGSVQAGAVLRTVDAADLTAADLDTVLVSELEAAGGRLDPESGTVLQAVHFDRGDRQPGRLLLVVHHLAVDAVSWRIIQPDLAAAARDEPLEPVGTSLRRWAGLLAEEARRPERIAETDHWLRILSDADPLLTDRPLDPAQDVVATLQEAGFTLTPEQTVPLLTGLPARYHGDVDDILLTALTVAVTAWHSERDRSVPCHGTLLVDLERHGRTDLGGSDLSRPVGWFTNVHPARLDLGTMDPGAALRDPEEADRALKQMKEQLRKLPGDGLGYGLLRYLNPDAAPLLSLAFNLAGHPTC
jgi:hypothetical protein